ncbi:MAG TPA: DUF421 domain-containing protein [Candidatus Gallacutalibacter pullistercoris]|nr:DUF421 domain-containing protein [Candidatus Gallacutalibacter pullistercoris]
MIISFVRTVLLYIVILAAVRLMGKRQISELQTSELVVTLLISDIAAIPMQDTGQPLASGFIPIAVLVMCEIAISVFMLKSGKFRRLVCGKPIVLINNGQLDQKEMSRLRLSIEDLFEELREKDVFSIRDVAWAIMETNGKLSIVKKPEADQPTNQLLGLCPSDTGLEVVVISDGEFSDSSLRLCGQSRRWAEDILSQQGLSLRQVFIMTADTQGGYAIIPKQGDNLSTMKGGSTS